MTAFLYITAALALVLATYLATGAALPKAPRFLLVATFLLVAALTTFAAFQIGNAGGMLVSLRPVLAMTLPAVLYLHIFSAIRAPARLVPRDAVNLVGPVGVVAIYVFQWSGPWIDIAIVSAHVIYLLLIAWVSRKGASSFAALGSGLADLFNQWRKLVQVFLLFVIISDTIIMLELAGNGDALAQSWGIALSSFVLACGMAWLLVAGLHRVGPLNWVATQHRAQPPGQSALVLQLEKALLETSAYLDPNLTLQKFSRKVGLPARNVSAAINDQRRCNYNHWVNGFRIREAQRIIQSQPEKSLTQVMFAAGFQNKSTFNAAFRALQGESPSNWRARISGNSHPVES